MRVISSDRKGSGRHHPHANNPTEGVKQGSLATLAMPPRWDSLGAHHGWSEVRPTNRSDPGELSPGQCAIDRGSYL
jgi:hypothetical protein